MWKRFTARAREAIAAGTSTVLELVAGICLVVAAAHVHPALAWLSAAVVLEAKVFEREQRNVRVRRRRGGSS